MSKSFLLTTLDCINDGTCDKNQDASYQYANEWLDHTGSVFRAGDLPSVLYELTEDGRTLRFRKR